MLTKILGQGVVLNKSLTLTLIAAPQSLTYCLSVCLIHRSHSVGPELRIVLKLPLQSLVILPRPPAADGRRRRIRGVVINLQLLQLQPLESKVVKLGNILYFVTLTMIQKLSNPTRPLNPCITPNRDPEWRSSQSLKTTQA